MRGKEEKKRKVKKKKRRRKKKNPMNKKRSQSIDEECKMKKRRKRRRRKQAQRPFLKSQDLAATPDDVTIEDQPHFPEPECLKEEKEERGLMR